MYQATTRKNPCFYSCCYCCYHHRCSECEFASQWTIEYLSAVAAKALVFAKSVLIVVAPSLAGSRLPYTTLEGGAMGCCQTGGSKRRGGIKTTPSQIGCWLSNAMNRKKKKEDSSYAFDFKDCPQKLLHLLLPLLLLSSSSSSSQLDDKDDNTRIVRSSAFLVEGNTFVIIMLLLLVLLGLFGQHLAPTCWPNKSLSLYHNGSSGGVCNTMDYLSDRAVEKSHTHSLFGQDDQDYWLLLLLPTNQFQTNCRPGWIAAILLVIISLFLSTLCQEEDLSLTKGNIMECNQLKPKKVADPTGVYSPLKVNGKRVSDLKQHQY